MFRHVVSSDAVEIEAPAEHVWAILMDTPGYAQWNAFTTRVDTNFEVGSPVDLYVTLGPLKLKQPERIQSVEPPHLLAWGMTMGPAWLLSARRDQRLEPLSATRCRYVTTDAFNGMLTPLVVWLFGGSIRRGFNAMALSLKQHAEAGFGGSRAGGGPP